MKIKKCIICISLFMASQIALVGCGNKEDAYYLSDEGYETFEEKETLTEVVNLDSDIYVDICGSVNNPGVYQLSSGARVYEAIERAGGLRDDACVEAINRAEPLSDGQKIYIMTNSEWMAEQAKKEVSNVVDDGKVNINTADENGLCALPGIGQTRATAIIAYREKNGPFSSIEEIQKVSGIKNGTYEKISELIKIE